MHCCVSAAHLKESIRTEESQARHSVFVQVHFGVERYVIGLGLGFVGVEEEGEEEDVDEGDEEVVGEGDLVVDESGLSDFETEDEDGWYGSGGVPSAFCFKSEEPMLVVLIL